MYIYVYVYVYVYVYISVCVCVCVCVCVYVFTADSCKYETPDFRFWTQEFGVLTINTGPFLDPHGPNSKVQSQESKVGVSCLRESAVCVCVCVCVYGHLLELSKAKRPVAACSQ
jgi:hypothetical protein